jgi:hypothetical protein
VVLEIVAIADTNHFRRKHLRGASKANRDTHDPRFIKMLVADGASRQFWEDFQCSFYISVQTNAMALSASCATRNTPHPGLAGKAHTMTDLNVE